ncbi:pyridoxal-phosphate-dependent aminotransferase family protein [Immundisolibacter cernigliae]|uniref:Alanine--glyoxylate aminotransferase n=1 Tax=Immundisolibacter cernigliae TaxID=1810504 RepID=A0A1B1YX48_9GAMM|nr:alanine--glyoxylate aminotransferase family protein [Immundisolibacter cernigliae]ANX05361.1 alanine--glyoxylate aminotransferase [Immundisolibacter cernigliae]
MPSFNPPLRTLMGPGPSDVHPRVLAAMARPTIGHLDPAFVGLMDDIKALLRQAFKTRNEVTFPISGPGSVGMEACFVNLVEPGDTVIVCRNGVFGGRMKENVERAGGVAIVVDDPWTRAVDPQRLEDALETNPQARLVAFVMAETSTGALSDASTLVQIAHRHGALAIVDAVTALGGVPLDVDGWDIDAIYSGTQKCLSCPPGLSPVSFGARALDKLRARKTPVQSWFLDLNLVLGYWSGAARRSYHHTAPINALYGLHEALLMLHEEGLEAAWARHALHHRALRAGLEAMDLRLAGADGERLPQLNVVGIPDGVDDARVRQTLLDDYDLEIGAGLGEFAGKAWRIGLMGQSASRRHVLACLTALGSAMAAQGRPSDCGAALAAAQKVYAA